MKKFYMLFLFVFVLLSANAQPATERYWVGPNGAAGAGTDFTLSTNWALTAGGTPGAGYAPAGSTEVNYIFSTAGTFFVSQNAAITGGFVTVKNGVNLTFEHVGNASANLVQNMQGVNVELGGVFKIANKNTGSANYTWAFGVAPGYASSINGEMIIEATNKNCIFGTGTFQPILTIGSTGIVRLNGNAASNIPASLTTTTAQLIVNSGGSIYVNNNGGATGFTGNFDVNSNIYIEGSTHTSSTAGKLSGTISAGNVIVNLPNAVPLNATAVGFPLFSAGGATIKGNLIIKNVGTATSGFLNTSSANAITINGNLILSNESGTTSPKLQVYLTPTTSTNNTNINIGGNLETQANTILDLGTGGTGTSLGLINVKGNVTLNGTLTETGGNMAIGGYPITLNGTGTQILSGTGSQTNDVSIAINKLSDSVNLGTDIITSTGANARFNFVSGKINGQGKSITISNNNTSTALGGGNSASYLYNGNLVRKTNSAGSTYVFPVGNPTDYFPAKIVPTSDGTDFSVRFYKPNTFVPLTGPTPINLISDYYWDIQVPFGTTSADVISLGYTSALSGVLDFNQVKVAHYNASTMAWENFGGTATVGSAGCPASNTCAYIDATTSPITTFSPFALGGIAGTLNLKVETFNAIKITNGASITWTAALNNNIASYEVLKSTNAINYNSITTVTAIGGRLSYSFLDANLANGVNYYKLKIIENNGQVSYSNVAIVNNQILGFEIISMVPTIVKNNAVISIASLNNTKANVVITDLLGKQVYSLSTTINAGNTNITINTLGFAKGVYQLKVINSQGHTSLKRFIKQ